MRSGPRSARISRRCRLCVWSLPSRTLLLNSAFQLSLEAAIDGVVVRSFDAEVVLIDPALRRVVSVLITFAVAESFCSGIVAVAKMCWDWQDSL